MTRRLVRSVLHAVRTRGRYQSHRSADTFHALHTLTTAPGILGEYGIGDRHGLHPGLVAPGRASRQLANGQRKPERLGQVGEEEPQLAVRSVVGADLGERAQRLGRAARAASGWRGGGMISLRSTAWGSTLIPAGRPSYAPVGAAAWQAVTARDGRPP
jgi:hypothetical protein